MRPFLPARINFVLMAINAIFYLMYGGIINLVATLLLTGVLIVQALIERKK